MSQDFDIVCDKCRTWHHLGQMFAGGQMSFGHGSKDEEGREAAMRFVVNHLYCDLDADSVEGVHGYHKDGTEKSTCGVPFLRVMMDAPEGYTEEELLKEETAADIETESDSVARVHMGTGGWAALSLTEQKAALMYKKISEGLNAEEAAHLAKVMQIMQTLKHHAEDMIAAGNAILERLGKQPASAQPSNVKGSWDA